MSSSIQCIKDLQNQLLIRLEKAESEIDLLRKESATLSEKVEFYKQKAEDLSRSCDRTEEGLEEAVELLESVYNNVDQYHLNFYYKGGECYEKLKDYLGK